MAKHNATKYKQGNGWVVSYWSSDRECYRITDEMSYTAACRYVKECNND
jgi:hypothetical protein